MNQLLEKINKNSLLVAIISTILVVYLIDPIIGILAKYLLLIYSSFSETLYDRLFQEISFGKPDYSYVIMQIIYSVMFFLMWISYKLVHGEDNKNHKKSKIFKNKYIMLTCFSITLILFIGLSVMSSIKLKTIQSFEQQIKIITPYINENTKELLISDFSNMQTSRDFEKIKTTITSIATKNNIKLPVTRNHLF